MIWSPQALDDLAAIHRYIGKDSRQHTDAFVARIVSAVDRLDLFPRSGRVVPDIERDDIREVIVRGYRVIYRLTGDEAEILTVHHGMRRLGDRDIG